MDFVYCLDFSCVLLLFVAMPLFLTESTAKNTGVGKLADFLLILLAGFCDGCSNGVDAVNLISLSDSDDVFIAANSRVKLRGDSGLSGLAADDKCFCRRRRFAPPVVRIGEGLMRELKISPRPSVGPCDLKNGVIDLKKNIFLDKLYKSQKPLLPPPPHKKIIVHCSIPVS